MGLSDTAGYVLRGDGQGHVHVGLICGSLETEGQESTRTSRWHVDPERPFASPSLVQPGTSPPLCNVSGDTCPPVSHDPERSEFV